MLNAYLENTLVYQPELCNGCGICAEVCPHAVFEMEGRRALLVRPTACMECGACQVNCVTGAIAVDYGVGCASLMIAEALRGKRGAKSERGQCGCG